MGGRFPWSGATGGTWASYNGPMPIAYSTVACPDWTLRTVADTARALGYEGVELRSFDSHSPDFACDPTMTASSKVRALFADAGVAPVGIATSAHFDAPVFPPVIGQAFGDHEGAIRLAKRAIATAREIGSSYVRVFGYELNSKEKLNSGVARIVERLKLAVAGARNTGVKVVIENGGSFATGESLMEIVRRIDSPTLRVAYSPAAALSAGEDPIEGLELLGDRLMVVKLKDHRAGTPCPIGEGDVPCEAVVRRLGVGVWGVVEWDRAWFPELDEPRGVLEQSIRRIGEWSAQLAASYT
jgi:sugar phosphate isomerase/epimerase